MSAELMDRIAKLVTVISKQQEMINFIIHESINNSKLERLIIGLNKSHLCKKTQISNISIIVKK